MFGKSFREPKPEETLETTILNQSSANPVDEKRPSFSESEADKSSVSQAEKKEIIDSNTPEIVITVEKISRIVSPYFIVLIGLSLYRENFFIGTILIGMGILVLLKISPKDISNFLKWVKNFLGFEEN